VTVGAFKCGDLSGGRMHQSASRNGVGVPAGAPTLKSVEIRE